MRDTEFLTTCTVLGCIDFVRVSGSPEKINDLFIQLVISYLFTNVDLVSFL